MTAAKTMRAAVLDTHGAAFRVAPVPQPDPQPGQVLGRSLVNHKAEFMIGHFRALPLAVSYG